MTIQDPDQPPRDAPRDTAYAAEVRETTVVTQRDNTGWWIAGAVALAAIAAVLWMVLASSGGETEVEALQEAVEDARIDAQLAGAQAQIDAAGDAASRAAADAARATADARNAAERAAERAVDQPPTVIIESPPQPAPEPEPAPLIE